MMHFLKRLGMTVFAVALMSLGAVQAQTVRPNEQSGELMKCLTKGEDALVYPERYRAAKLGGFVRVKLSFERADRKPEVEVLSRAMPDELLEAVQDYLRNYRLPCLPAGQTVVAVQEFSFSLLSSKEVTWSDARGVNAAASADVAHCLRTPPQAVQPPWGSDLTGFTSRKGFGNLLLELEFDTADAPPKVKIVYDTVSSKSRQSILDYVEQYRMPCLKEGGRPVTVEQQFQVNNSDSNRMEVARDLDLGKFLGAIKDVTQQKVRFDLNTMACPFQVVWNAGMPIRKNRVGEVGVSNLNRTEFLAWLSGLSLNVPPQTMEQLLGQSMVISVPCGTIDLSE